MGFKSKDDVILLCSRVVTLEDIPQSDPFKRAMLRRKGQGQGQGHFAEHLSDGEVCTTQRGRHGRARLTLATGF
jgi:hypothetical protein